MEKLIRVLIADDHAIVRRGLRTLINSQADMEVVDEAADGIEAVLKARAVTPDVILMDMVMPRQEGAAAIRQIKQENPAARILVLTSFAEDDKIFPAIKSGALGYLLKDAETDQLLHAIRDVNDGKSSLDPNVALRHPRTES
ncbi:MAG: response regulator transcription factor [Caldilineaceae bacterium]